MAKILSYSISILVSRTSVSGPWWTGKKKKKSLTAVLRILQISDVEHNLT
jgi:hypothetical protein